MELVRNHFQILNNEPPEEPADETNHIDQPKISKSVYPNSLAGILQAQTVSANSRKTQLKYVDPYHDIGMANNCKTVCDGICKQFMPHTIDKNELTLVTWNSKIISSQSLVCLSTELASSAVQGQTHAGVVVHNTLTEDARVAALAIVNALATRVPIHPDHRAFRGLTAKRARVNLARVQLAKVPR